QDPSAPATRAGGVLAPPASLLPGREYGDYARFGAAVLELGVRGSKGFVVGERRESLAHWWRTASETRMDKGVSGRPSVTKAEGQSTIHGPRNPAFQLPTCS